LCTSHTTKPHEIAVKCRRIERPRGGRWSASKPSLLDLIDLVKEPLDVYFMFVAPILYALILDLVDAAHIM
jgi:hypothetical protein